MASWMTHGIKLMWLGFFFNLAHVVHEEGGFRVDDLTSVAFGKGQNFQASCSQHFEPNYGNGLLE